MTKTKRTQQKKLLSQADAARFLKARKGHGDIAAYQILQWVSRARHYTTRVAEGDIRPEVVSVFWTTSYGVMLDVRELVVRHRGTLISSDKCVLRTFGLSKSLISQLDMILECIDAMYAAFNEDELAYLEYRRHVECHPLQHGYEMKVSDGKIIDRTRKLTKRLWTHEEEDAALRRVFRRYGRIFAEGPDETPIARAFAARMTPFLDRLGPALVPIFGSDQFSWEERETRPKRSL